MKTRAPHQATVKCFRSTDPIMTPTCWESSPVPSSLKDEAQILNMAHSTLQNQPLQPVHTPLTCSQQPPVMAHRATCSKQQQHTALGASGAGGQRISRCAQHPAPWHPAEVCSGCSTAVSTVSLPPCWSPCIESNMKVVLSREKKERIDYRTVASKAFAEVPGVRECQERTLA